MVPHKATGVPQDQAPDGNDEALMSARGVCKTRVVKKSNKELPQEKNSS